MKTTRKTPDIYCGLALDTIAERVIMSSFGEDKAKVAKSTQDQNPGLSVHIFKLFDKPAKIKQDLFNYLRGLDVPSDQWLTVFGLIVEGLRGVSSKKEDDDEEVCCDPDP